MGYNSEDRFVYLLEGGDVVISGTTGDPIQLAGNGPWSNAFPDTVQRRRASAGIAQIIKSTQLDPETNYVDFLKPVYSSIVTPDHFIESSTSESGSRSLRINAGAGPTDIDLRGPVFRLSENQSYRFSIRYQTDTLTNNQFNAGVDTFGGDFTSIGGSYLRPSLTLPGTNNVWTWASFVFTPTASERFGVARVLDQPAKDGYLLFDKILIEPVGGLVHRRTDAGQSIATGGTGDTVVWEDAVSTADNDLTYSAGTFTVVRPGDYSISANIMFELIADTVLYGIRITAGGQTYWGGLHTQSGANFGGTALTVPVRLDRGDTIVVAAYHAAAAAEALDNNGDFNWVTIKRID